MRRVVLALIAVAVLAPAGHAASTVTDPVYDSKGRLVQAPFAPVKPHAHLTEERATAIFVRDDKVADWIGRYPKKGRVTEATYDPKRGDWKMGIWWDSLDQIALGRVDDGTGVVTEAWTGPQVAWKMARGTSGAFGGKEINTVGIWLAFCIVFLLGLADLRRPLSLRNLDLVVLLSFSVSLWFFNRGEIFTSVPLAYPPLLYLLGRMVWSVWRGGPGSSRSVWPLWLLAAATVFLTGFRIGLNVRDSNVIDVGYAGVIGANRIVNGQSPYGHMPIEGSLKPCGPKDADGEIRERVQTNGRCESANGQGDTYGPVAYEAYIPAYGLLGWSGKWDKLPAAHATAVAFDLLALLGLLLLGLRFGGTRLAVMLPFSWAAYPFTQYASSSNTNDTIMPVLLIFGFWLVTSAFGRGAFLALAGWTKFGALLVVPLWAGYPEPRRLSGKVTFAGGFAVATLAAFSILLLEPNPAHAARVFWDRTFGWQVGRDSPFSIWGWGQYHAAGIPDLGFAQQILIGLLAAGALACYFVPRSKTPLQLAALTAALMIGFELTLTHWFYLYIPWFFPFVAFVVLAPRRRREPAPPSDSEARELVPAG
ncbi:MAG TPA: hypothetical protein VK488_08575 [Gaiellaceae bacterium]|nr:hypothetical protein [Gaiellaceae bacterium]